MSVDPSILTLANSNYDDLHPSQNHTTSFEAFVSKRRSYPYKCPFDFMNCDKVFANPIDQKRHASNCLYSAFLTCRSSDCVRNDRFLFNHTAHLFQHSIEAHGRTEMNKEGAYIIEMAVSKTFLFPAPNTFKSIVLGKTNVFLGGVNYPVGVMMLCALDGEPDAEPEVMIVPVKLQPNNNYVHYLIKMLGAEDTIIPTMLNPAKMSEGRSSELTAIQAFNSPLHFFVNLKSSRIPRYSSRQILQSANMTAAPGFVTIKIYANAKIMQCNVETHGQGQLQPFGQFWEDLNLLRPIKLNMIESREKQPKAFSKIIIPQIKSDESLIVESRYIYQSKNALVAGILDYIKFPTDPRVPVPCRCIVLMPSMTMLMNQFRVCWCRYIRDTQMTIFQLETVTSDLVQQFKTTGATVIMSMLSDLISLLDTKDDQLQSMLRNDLRHIHIYLPDRFPKEGLKVLHDKLVMTTQFFTKSAYSEVVSDEVRANLVQNVGFENSVFMSVGSNPRFLISRYIMNIHSEDSVYSRSIQAKNLIESEQVNHGPKRWLIFVRSTVLPYINILKMALDSHRHPITFFTTHERVRNNPNFFNDFQRFNNGILVLPYDALDFGEVRYGEKTLLFEEPTEEWEATMVRIIVRSMDPSGTVRPIIMLSQREHGHVQF